MRDERLEFAISEYLDGSLGAEDAAALEARLAGDAEARELLEEYRKLEALLKGPAALGATPAIAWEKLAGQIGGAVAEAERLEFAVAQYVDGTLPADEAEAVEARIAEDTTAQGLVEEHRRVVAALKSAPVPAAVRWNKLAEHISVAVAEANAPAVTIKLFARPWARGAAGLAIAACIAMASAVGIRGYLSHHKAGGPQIAVNTNGEASVRVASGSGSGSGSAKPIEVRIGSGDEDGASGNGGGRTAVALVTIGAGMSGTGVESGGNNGGGGDGVVTFAEGIVARSPRSLIATGSPTAQDNAMMPY